MSREGSGGAGRTSSTESSLDEMMTSVAGGGTHESAPAGARGVVMEGGLLLLPVCLSVCLSVCPSVCGVALYKGACGRPEKACGRAGGGARLCWWSAVKEHAADLQTWRLLNHVNLRLGLVL